jgi:hypothetical protein
MKIENYNKFINHMNNRQRLDLGKFETDILNEKFIKKCILSKENLSAPGLDRLTYQVFKYCPYTTAKLFKFIK